MIIVTWSTTRESDVRQECVLPVSSSSGSVVFIDLFNDAVCSAYCQRGRWMMSRKWYGRKRSWPNLRFYPGSCLDGPKITTKNLRISDIRAEIWTRNLPNTKQGCVMVVLRWWVMLVDLFVHRALNPHIKHSELCIRWVRRIEHCGVVVSPSVSGPNLGLKTRLYRRFPQSPQGYSVIMH
jgi:hypothetical protein